MKRIYLIFIVICISVINVYYSNRIENLSLRYNNNLSSLNMKLIYALTINNLNAVYLDSFKKKNLHPNKIVLYVSKLDCMSCLDSISSAIKSIDSNILSNSFIIVINSSNSKFLHYFKIKNNFYNKGIVFNFPIKEIEERYNLSKPLLFFYDSLNRLQYPLIVSSKNTRPLKEQLKFIKNKFVGT